MAGIYHPSRGGVRGGKDQFNWDDVKTDKDRENYLGHSLMVPVGKWQEGKDLMWYTRGKNDHEKAEFEKKKRDELQGVKDLEKRAMEAALGKKSFSMGTTSLTTKELQEVLLRGKTEHGGEDRIHGVGHKKSSKSKSEKYGATFEGFDASGTNHRNDSDKEQGKKHKKKKKEKKKKKKKMKEQSDDSNDDILPRKRRHSTEFDERNDRYRYSRGDEKSSNKRNYEDSKNVFSKYRAENRDARYNDKYDSRKEKHSDSRRQENDDRRREVDSYGSRELDSDRRQQNHDSRKNERYDSRTKRRSNYSDSERNRKGRGGNDRRSDDRSSSKRRRRNDSSSDGSD